MKRATALEVVSGRRETKKNRSSPFCAVKNIYIYLRTKKVENVQMMKLLAKWTNYFRVEANFLSPLMRNVV